MVKTLIILLQNQESFEAESLYTAFGTQIYQVYSKDAPRLTFDHFYEKVKFASLCICMGIILKNLFFLKMY